MAKQQMTLVDLKEQLDREHEAYLKLEVERTAKVRGQKDIEYQQRCITKEERRLRQMIEELERKVKRDPKTSK